MEQRLGQKLLYSTFELENLKAETRDEMKKNKEYVNELIQHLKVAIQERDEARIQIQNLLNGTVSLTTTTKGLPTVPLFQADSPLFIPRKANSSVTESNSLLETYNYGSSPIDSLFDGVSSPEFSSINLVFNQPLVQDHPNALPPNIDHGSLIIEDLVKGRALPKKGKFMQAILESGPLLQTLLVAGPLPRWRNPPQLQSFQVPSVSIKGCGPDVFTNKQGLNMAYKSHNSQPYASFANYMSPGTCLRNGPLLSSGTNSNGYVSLAKKQKVCSRLGC